MNKILSTPFFLIWFISSFSQKICLIDSVSTLPIPYVSIYIYDHGIKKGGFTGSNTGCGIIPKMQFTHLQITSLGYENLYIPKSSIQDTIYLTPRIYELEQINIKLSKNVEKITYDRRRFDYRYALVMDSEFALYFKNDFKKPVSIKSFFFKVKKSLGKTVFRIIMYKVVDPVLHSTVGESLLSQDILYTIPPDTEGLVKIDLAPYNLILPTEGAYLGTDTLENLDENGNININTKYITRIESVIWDLNYFLIYNKYRANWRNIHNFNQEHFKSFKRNRRDFGFPNFGIEVFTN